jgi:hypothetical protein
MMNPPRVLILLIALIALCGVVSAYQLVLDAPREIQVGMPLIVTGTTNLPAGTSTEMTFSLVEYTQTLINTQPVTIQGEKEFKVKFDTAGLKKGTYKVEIKSSRELSSDSQTIKVVQLIDRSDEIQLTSSQKQDFTGSLIIAGSAPKDGAAGIQIQVSDENGNTVFGPEYVPTTKEGAFSKKITIPSPGAYDVAFSDAKGLIGTFQFTSVRIATVAPSVTSITPAETEIVPGDETISATSFASREKPAYFSVATNKGPVKIYTSTGIDWVVEYSVDGVTILKVNDRGTTSAEQVAIDGNGETVHVKVYPYYGEGNVTLYADNAGKILIETGAAPVFGDTRSTPTAAPTKSPLAPLTIIGGVIVSAGIAAWHCRRG